MIIQDKQDPAQFAQYCRSEVNKLSLSLGQRLKSLKRSCSSYTSAALSHRSMISQYFPLPHNPTCQGELHLKVTFLVTLSPCILLHLACTHLQSLCTSLQLTQGPGKPHLAEARNGTLKWGVWGVSRAR